MRQIHCTDKECELLPSTQYLPNIIGENIEKTSSSGLNPDSPSTLISLNSARSTVKRKQKRMKPQLGKKRQAVKKVQIGGIRKKKPIKNQKGGTKRRCLKGNRK